MGVFCLTAPNMAARVSRVSAGDSEDSEAADREERDVLAPPQPAPASVLSTTGYEGSEDESAVEAAAGPELKIRLLPLASVCVTHPYLAASLGTAAGTKVDLSLYNMSLAVAPQGFHLPARSGKKVPWLR